jgi:hypothetical protein
MPTEVYRCEDCMAIYDTRDEARLCEAKHEIELVSDLLTHFKKTPDLEDEARSKKVKERDELLRAYKNPNAEDISPRIRAMAAAMHIAKMKRGEDDG